MAIFKLKNKGVNSVNSEMKSVERSYKKIRLIQSTSPFEKKKLEDGEHSYKTIRMQRRKVGRIFSNCNRLVVDYPMRLDYSNVSDREIHYTNQCYPGFLFAKRCERSFEMLVPR